MNAIAASASIFAVLASFGTAGRTDDGRDSVYFSLGGKF